MKSAAISIAAILALMLVFGGISLSGDVKESAGNAIRDRHALMQEIGK